MKLKQRVGDFRVRELLADGYLAERGAHRVYRVTKKKLTTIEAVRVLAQEAGVDQAAVGIAGMKDRQGVTVQHMSLTGGRDVHWNAPDLRIETAGFAAEPFSSAFSRGNAFELTVRALRKRDVQRLRDNLPVVREHGVVNFFDDQRFGNLTHGQGWVARRLMRGEHEAALRDLLTGRGDFERQKDRAFKEALEARWGDWQACREIAGSFGAHHSVFEHLGRDPEDFAGAFTYVASRLRLIHLYAYQSHVWNRAVAQWVRELTPVDERLVFDGLDSPRVAFGGARPAALAHDATFRLPGEGLEDVTDDHQHRLLRDVLAEERMVPDQFRIQGVSGFALKGEDRPVLVVPEHLRVRPAEPDVLNRGMSALRVRFELPRGAYATLVVKRLLASALKEQERHSVLNPAARREDGRGYGREDRDGDRGGRRGSFGGDRGRWGDRDRDDRRGGSWRGDDTSRPERGGGWRSGREGDRRGATQGWRSREDRDAERPGSSWGGGPGGGHGSGHGAQGRGGSREGARGPRNDGADRGERGSWERGRRDGDRDRGAGRSRERSSWRDERPSGEGRKPWTPKRDR